MAFLIHAIRAFLRPHYRDKVGRSLLQRAKHGVLRGSSIARFTILASSPLFLLIRLLAAHLAEALFTFIHSTSLSFVWLFRVASLQARFALARLAILFGLRAEQDGRVHEIIVVRVTGVRVSLLVIHYVSE